MNIVSTFCQKQYKFLNILRLAFSGQKRTGKQLFLSLYFPIKRIQFKDNKYQQIFYAKQIFTETKIKWRISMIYSLPFTIYLSNFLFFFDWSYYPHYFGLTFLGLLSLQKTIRDFNNLARRAVELHINQDADKFVAVFKYSVFLRNLDEKVPNIQSQINEFYRISYEFELNDILDIGMLRDRVKEYKNQKKKQILGELKAAQQTDEDNEENDQNKKQNTDINKEEQEDVNISKSDDSVVIIVQKKNQKHPIAFFIDIDKNELPGFNDYLIALGSKKRIIMRSAVIDKEKENIEKMKTQLEKDKAYQQDTKQPTQPEKEQNKQINNQNNEEGQQKNKQSDDKNKDQQKQEDSQQQNIQQNQEQGQQKDKKE